MPAARRIISDSLWPRLARSTRVQMGRSALAQHTHNDATNQYRSSETHNRQTPTCRGYCIHAMTLRKCAQIDRLESTVPTTGMSHARHSDSGKRGPALIIQTQGRKALPLASHHQPFMEPERFIPYRFNRDHVESSFVAVRDELDLLGVKVEEHLKELICRVTKHITDIDQTILNSNSFSKKKKKKKKKKR